MTLEQVVVRTAERFPQATAVSAADGELSYGQLDRDANRLARALAALGVQKGDRVGIWTEKSTRAVTAMQAVLRLGAAYVPIDPLNPATRSATILKDCASKVVFTTSARAPSLVAEGLAPQTLFCLDTPAAGAPGGSWADLSRFEDAPLPAPPVTERDLAYILYTSGSTGVPKGVCISHLNALAFIDWCVEVLGARPEDHFSNHAPFSFDLSVLDLYTAFSVGAKVSLVPEGLAYSPRALVEYVRSRKFTVWYSVPSALILMIEQGELLAQPWPELRALLFAGEVFPIKDLRRLRGHLPHARFLNLYGPTETNVCTWHEVHDIPATEVEPVPIGKASCGDRVVLRNLQPRNEDDPTVVGELWIEGPTVMLGYWGKPPQEGAYNTGDLVSERPDGTLIYRGRRDNMVKVRGRRIELGEVEATLLAHPQIKECAVLVAGEGTQARLVAVLVPQGAEPSLLELKRHCAARLPRYMLVDEVRALPQLPRTPNGKIDRRKLASELVTPTP